MAAYDAAVAQAGADQSTLKALQAQLNSLNAQINTDDSTVAADTAANNAAQAVVTADAQTIEILSYVYDGLEIASAIASTVGDGLQVGSDAAESIPIVGPSIAGPLGIAATVLTFVSDGLTIAADSIEFALTALGVQESNDESTAATTQNQLDVDQAQYQTDQATQTDLQAATASVQADLTAEHAIVKADAVIVTASQIASAQATASLVNTAPPLPLTVAGPVDITDQGNGASGGSIIVNTPITVAAPGGAQVSFTATNGAITSVTPTPANGGSGYPASSIFDLAVAGGSGGVVQATTNSNGAVISFAATPLAGGSGYTTATGANTDPNAVVATTGSGAQVSFTTTGGVITSVDSTPGADGSGYPADSTFDLSVTGGGGSGGVVQAMTDASGNVTSFSLLAGGSGYATPGLTSGSPTGSGAQVLFTAAGGIITSVNSTPAAGGSGYPDSATFDLVVTGGTSGIVLATTNASGNVISFSLVAGGIGYTGTTTGLAGVTINTNSPLTVGATITAPGAIDLTADNVTIAAGTTINSGSTITITGDANDAGSASVTVNGTLNAQSALIDMDAGSPGDDTFNITPSATTPITVTGVGPDNTLNFNALGRTVTISETPTGDTITAAGMQPVTTNNIAFVNIINGAGANLAGVASGSAPLTLNSVPLSASSAWVNQYGSFAISGTTDTAQGLTSLATINGISNAANEADSLTITSLAPGQQAGLVSRYSGSGLTNMYYGSIMATSADTYTAYIYVNVNGVSTPLFSQNYTGTTTGDTLEFDVVDSSLQLFVNGSLVGYANDSTFAAGAVGILTMGGAVVVSNFNATPITQQTATNNTYSDNFSTQGQSAITSASNGQLDDYWVNQYGDFTTNGTGTAKASSLIALATVNGTNTAANESADLTISSLAPGQQVGLAARYSGSGLGSMYYGSIMATSANTYTAAIFADVNGAFTPLFSQNYTGAPGGQTLEFDVDGSSLQLSLGGSLVAYANNSTFATGSVGMLTSGGQVVVSNFNAAPITQQTASTNSYSSYSDNFTTANNGQLDDYWANQYGVFKSGGTGTATASTGIALATVNGISNANEAVSLTINSLMPGQQVGLAARYSGSGLGDMYYGSIVPTSANSYTAAIFLDVNGAFTPLFSQNYTGTTTGKTLEFDVVGSSLQLSLGNSLVAYANDSTFATGGVGMLTSGGQVVVSNFNATPITQQTTSNNGAYSDNFTTANHGELDYYWVNQYGAFTSGGTGTATAANPFASLATVNGISNANEAVSLTINALATGQQVGLAARYSGSGLGSMYYGSIVPTSANSYTVAIFLDVNGVFTPLISQSYTGTTTGKTLEFDVVGSSLQLFLNGSLVADANNSTFATGSVGMLTSGAAVAVSNFNAAPITQQTASNPFTDTFSTQGSSAITSTANGQLDNSWVNQFGYFTTSGTGTATAGNPFASLATVNGISNANEAVSLTINSLMPGQQVGLAARYSGSGLGSMYYGSIVPTSANSYTAAIFVNVNGAFTPLFSQNYTGTTTSKTLEFDVVGSSLQLFLNGSLVAYASNSTFATGGVGMLTSGGAVVVSNFNAAPITQQAASQLLQRHLQHAGPRRHHEYRQRSTRQLLGQPVWRFHDQRDGHGHGGDQHRPGHGQRHRHAADGFKPLHGHLRHARRRCQRRRSASRSMRSRPDSRSDWQLATAVRAWATCTMARSCPPPPTRTPPPSSSTSMAPLRRCSARATRARQPARRWNSTWSAARCNCSWVVRSSLTPATARLPRAASAC